MSEINGKRQVGPIQRVSESSSLLAMTAAEGIRHSSCVRTSTCKRKIESATVSRLMDGPLNPHDIFDVSDMEAPADTRERNSRGLCLQGVKIKDKHIEVSFARCFGGSRSKRLVILTSC